MGIPRGGFHAARHGATSEMLANGVAPTVVQKQMRRFSESAGSPVASSMEILANVISGRESEATLIPAVDGPLSLFIRDTDANSDNRKVFVAHGHAEKPKQAVADFLRSGGLEPIILHEQPNEGKTIIEKFEKHSDVVGFAVVLLTPDDFGGPAGHREKAVPRARQNVVLELGCPSSNWCQMVSILLD